MSKDKHNGYLDMELLRFTTAGSVDDGKSTLIGRLLYDSKAIFEDQLEALEKASEISADELERAEKEIDKITGDHVDRIDAALVRKEAELLEV